MTGFAPDDLTFTLRHFLPHLNRDAIYRILKAEGLGRLPPPPSTKPEKEGKEFKPCDLGFLHIDIKHLPKLQTADGERRKLAVEHRMTKPHPKTNGMVERFNGRIGREVLVMGVGTHRDLECLLRGYNLAYNARRQRGLDGCSPDEVVRERLKEARTGQSDLSATRSLLPD